MRLKGKKIAVFNALPHHSRFLFPIADEARQQGAEILFFTTMVDYPYELEIIKRKFNFKFIIEYADETTKTKIKKSTNELLDKWSKMHMTWHGFRHWSLYQQHRSLMRNVEDYFCMEEFMKTEKPDMILTLHEMNPWGKQIGHLAHKYNILYLTLQEGDYYHNLLNLTTHAEYSIANLLWGKSAQSILLRHNCDIAKTIITGNTYIDETMKKYSSPTTIKEIKKELGIPAAKKIVTFILNTFWGTVLDKTVWKNTLKELNRHNIFCIFKWHPQTSFFYFDECKKIIKDTLPESIVLFSFDPYKLLALSHYCVTMGRTTMAAEALAFGKPLFELYNIIDGDEFYSKLNVAQSVSPLGNWEPLFKTMLEGVPAEIDSAAKEYVEKVFYKLDGKSVERALNVIDYILENKAKDQDHGHINFAYLNSYDAGRLSLIIPSGDDLTALIATLNSLSKYASHSNCEYIVVINNNKMAEIIPSISQDIKCINALDTNNLAALYNTGAKHSTGQYLVFIKPGILYYKDTGLIETLEEDCIVNIPIYNPDLSVFSLGFKFNFNYTPVANVGSESAAELSNMLLIAINRQTFEKLKGFDDNVAFFASDLTLCAKQLGISFKLLSDCAAIMFKTTMPTQYNGQYDSFHWQTRMKFFCRWWDRLSKDDNFLEYAKEHLKQNV
ncbi:Glycosyl transferase, family 2 domain protein [Candidatus Magnetoovum chiemensis]|nr:Glycosyl transferase, family 2 domain protein [Candidatus Magnetoovum chiemensis]